jgi:hypothetical protein
VGCKIDLQSGGIVSSGGYPSARAQFHACKIICANIDLQRIVAIGCHLGDAPTSWPLITINTQEFISIGCFADSPITFGPTALLVGGFVYNDLSGAITLNGVNGYQLAAGFVEHVQTVAAGPNINIALQNGAKPSLLLDQNVTITAFQGLQPGAQYVLRLVQDGVGGRTVTWPASVRWAGGLPPVLSVAPNAVDVVTMVSFDGTTLLAVPNLNFL